MHEAFRTGFEKAAKAPSLVPYHAPVDSAPPEHIERAPLTPSLGDTVTLMGTKVLGRTAGTALKAMHLPREAMLAVVVPQRLESIAARSSTGEHSAAPIQTHEGVM
jgi:hypothetical protein